MGHTRRSSRDRGECIVDGYRRQPVVAPVTRTVRNIPTEVILGSDEGLHVECAASFDNLQRIRRSALVERIGNLGLRHDELCASLRALADC